MMIKTFFSRTVALLSIGLLAFAALIVPATTVEAAYPGGDCDSNAIIHCGIRDNNELKQKYRANQGGDLKAVFSHFGMKNESSLNGMERGRVTKSGDIYVGSRKVAHGAVTTGRVRMGADEKKVPGAKAYMRPPSRSFRSNSLEALIRLNSRGEFMYGVIMSCGNPVQGHAIKVPAPPKQPTPPEKPKPKPKPQPEKHPDLEIEKDVRTEDGAAWEEVEAEADPGASIEYRITVTNTGDTTLKNVRIHDTLPSGISYEDGQVLQGSSTATSKTLGDLIGDGITIDSLKAGGLIEIRFSVTVEEAYIEAGDCEELRNIARAESDKVGEKQDDVTVEVCEPEQPEEPEKEEPQVNGAVTPEDELPKTGAAGVAGVFTATSIFGLAAYKLKEFFLAFLR